MHGPYDALYASVPENILWGRMPTHLMGILTDHKSAGKALDLGCGDGANSLYLENRGFSVTGIDVSFTALQGLRNRFRRENVQPRGLYLHADVRAGLQGTTQYDVLISCGVYHCLDKLTRSALHRKLHRLLTEDGVVLFSCITNRIPLPGDHLTDTVELANPLEVVDMFRGMSIEYYKEGVIQDRHGSLVAPHEHSVLWIVARK